MTALQRKLINKRKLLLRHYYEERSLVEQLQGNCDHSQTEEFKWEHDNGYGRQSMNTGHRCIFCGWVKYYKTWDRFMNPRDTY